MPPIPVHSPGPGPGRSRDDEASSRFQLFLSGASHPGSRPPRLHRARDGTRFLLSRAPVRQITEIPAYTWHDLRPEDRVLDIGANAGAFCIRAARVSHHVAAVEPVTAALLRENIRENGVEIRVIEAALGDGRERCIEWDGWRTISRTLPLRGLIRMAGGCDFLKCDCEGAEWVIAPRDLAGVRRIEMELHQPPIGGHPEPALLEYIVRFYDFSIDRNPVHGLLGEMGVLHAWRKERV